MSHVNKVIDADPHFEIDINTRNIKNVSQSKVSLVQYDHNSERFSFTLPRFVEGHDMLECNVVQVHYLSTANPDERGLYQITDLAECEENTDNVCCTWLISQNVTQNAGAIQFLLRFACVAEDGTIEYAWHTNPFTGIHVSAGMDNAEYIIEMYADIIEQWKNELWSTIKEDVVDAVLDDIKEVGIGGGGISAVETVSGETVSIADTVIHSINRVRVTGIDNPKSVTVARCGKNILGFREDTGGTMYGITCTFNPETQEITLNGTSTYNLSIDGIVYFKICPFLKYNTKCTLSIKHIRGTISGIPIGSGDDQVFVCARRPKASSYTSFIYTKFPTNNDTIACSGAVPKLANVNGGHMFVQLSPGGVGVVFDNYTFKVQVEMGDTATEWEPFVCDTYSPNEQGIAKDITPLPSTNTLLTDTADAVIECTYEKDIVPYKANKEDVSNAVKRTVTGSTLVIDDISPFVDELKVKVTQSNVDSPVIYKRIGDNLWNKNITKNDDTGKHDSDLIPCEGGKMYDIYSPTYNLGDMDVTFYDSKSQVIKSSVVNVTNDLLVVPDNCGFFKLSKYIIDNGMGQAFQLLLTIYKVESYVPINEIVTIPSPFDNGVYLYSRYDSSQFECEYNVDINAVIEGSWELISSGTLTKEVSSLTLDGFSCSKVELKISVASSGNNPSESALRLRTNINSNTGGGSDESLTRMFRTSGTNTAARILLEMHNKTIKGQLVNSGVNKTYANYYYTNPSVTEYDSITGVYLSPATSGCVFGASTTYELWGVRK